MTKLAHNHQNIHIFFVSNVWQAAAIKCNWPVWTVNSEQRPTDWIIDGLILGFRMPAEIRILWLFIYRNLNWNCKEFILHSDAERTSFALHILQSNAKQFAIEKD